MNRLRIVALLIALLALAAAAPAAYAQWGERGRTTTVSYDVAEDMTRFVFDKDVVFDDGMPADGSAFITRGYLYPAGTLSCDADGQCNGTNADGSPEFPDKVIGEWICQGYMINDAAHATTGVWVFSTQFYQAGSETGAQTVVTQGYELADIGVAVRRAITGGTGAYALARGEQEQQLLGFNASAGVVLRVSLNVQSR